MLTEHELRAVFEAAPDAILVVDDRGAIQETNARVEEMFGYAKEELVGEGIEILVPRDARVAHREFRDEYVEHPRHRSMRIGADLGGRRKDGSIFPVDISLSPVRSDGSLYVIAAVRDVSERRRLREWGVASLRAAEEERERIARELHDDMAQRLAALLVHLRLARLAEDEERERLLDELRGEVQACTEAVRSIARGLRPPVLDEVGIVAAIQGLVRETRDRSDIEIEMSVERTAAALELGHDAELALYRIVQEALTNVLRHSDSSHTLVRLEVLSHGVTVYVEDDGCGFDPGAVELKGLGLVGMAERARNAGGDFEIESRSGEGTRVRAFIPTREVS